VAAGFVHAVLYYVPGGQVDKAQLIAHIAFGD